MLYTCVARFDEKILKKFWFLNKPSTKSSNEIPSFLKGVIFRRDCRILRVLDLLFRKGLKFTPPSFRVLKPVVAVACNHQLQSTSTELRSAGWKPSEACLPYATPRQQCMHWICCGYFFQKPFRYRNFHKKTNLSDTEKVVQRERRTC